MERGLHLKVRLLLILILLANMLFCQAAAGKDKTDDPTSDWVSSDLDINLPERDQELVITAIKASDLPDSEKKTLIKSLKDIWSGRSDLSEPKQNQVLLEASFILNQYLGIDRSGASILWNWDPHAELARIAGDKWGLDSVYSQILYNEANTPDTWIRLPGDHFWYISISMGSGPYYTKRYADEARSYLTDKKNSDPEEGYTRLAWSMHYMSDLANPWHTTLFYGQWWHAAYESYVGDNWYGGHEFYYTVLDADYDYQHIDDPETSAKELAATSNEYIELLVDTIESDPDGWRDDTELINVTEMLLIEAARHNMGLIEYSTRTERGSGKDKKIK